MKKFLALLLVVVMVLSLVACNKEPEYEKVDFDDQSYTYLDATGTLPTNWNPHTYQTTDDSYPLDYTTDELFTAFYNDALHPVEGKEAYEGYIIEPAMAADYPVDVTTSVKAEHPEFNIPDSADSGYAWSVKLRTDLKWDDGTAITAQDFVDSLERVLRGELLNYRAADYYDGSYVVVNADKYSLQGTSSGVAIGVTTSEYLETGSVDDLYVDCWNFWGAQGYIDADGNTCPQWVSVNDETVYGADVDDAFSGKDLYDTYFAPGAPYEDYAVDYVGTLVAYDDNYSFSNVGLYVSGENELTFVYRNAVEGFYLMTYAMSVPLVKIDLYDSLLVENAGVWTSTYNTNVETSASYGPYKVSEYQTDKYMHFVKNENWYGWNSGTYVYVDPQDGKEYNMYQTTDIDLQVVSEAATRKTMFLAGQLVGYGLQAEDYDQYRSSEYCYATPGQAIFGLILNGYTEVIEEREAASDFDQSTTDLEMMTVEAFKKALAVSVDRDDFCATVQPARSAGFGLIGTLYVYDPETGALYRDTDQAKQALCDFYSINVDDYGGDLDKAVDAITGFDTVKAAELFNEAYEEGIAAGYITDSDGDGICDQTVTMTYALSSEASDSTKKMQSYLIESFNKAAAGTPFEGKITIVFSAPLGNDWSNAIMNGTADCVLAGWSGATMDPFGFADTWTGSRSYWTNWFDSSKVNMTLTIEGEELTMTLREWAECLNGNTKTVNGKDYNFGYGQTDVEIRLDILAACEKEIMGAYVSLPMIADGSMALLSQQVYYVVEEYNPIMGRGGIAYLKYNYSDTEWADYIAEQGGTLQY